MPGFKVAYSPESLQEINRIVDWYNASAKGLVSDSKKICSPKLPLLNKTRLRDPSVMMKFALPW